MDVFGQIHRFISLFIQYASWNLSKNVSYLKHNNIYYILKKLWIGIKQTYLSNHRQRKTSTSSKFGAILSSRVSYLH